jgi:hypothetical protein
MTALQHLLKRIKSDTEQLSKIDSEYQAGYKQALVDLEHYTIIQLLKIETEQTENAYYRGRESSYAVKVS